VVVAWQYSRYRGDFVAGLFWRNPQFSLTIPDDGDHLTDVVISLMQEALRLDQNFSIGFMIYKVKL